MKNPQRESCIVLLVLCLATTVVTAQQNGQLERLDDVVGDDLDSSHGVLGRIVGGNRPSVIIQPGESGASTTPTSTSVKGSTLMRPQDMRVQANLPMAGTWKKKPAGSSPQAPTRRPSGATKPESSNWHPVLSSAGTSSSGGMNGRPGQQDLRPAMGGTGTSYGVGSGTPTRHDSSAGGPHRPQLGSPGGSLPDQKRPSASRPTLNGPHRPLETGTSQQNPNYRPNSPEVQPSYRPSGSVPDRLRPVDTLVAEEGEQNPELTGMNQGRRGIGSVGPAVSGSEISGQGFPGSEFIGSGQGRPGFSGQGLPGVSVSGLSRPEYSGQEQQVPGFAGPGISAPGFSGAGLPGSGFSAPGGPIDRPQTGYHGIVPQQNPALYPNFQFGGGADLPFGAGLFNLGVVNIQKAVAAAAADTLAGNFDTNPAGLGHSSTFGHTTSFSYSDGRAAARKR